MKLMMKDGKMKMENLTKLSREEDGSDAQEWKEITVEEDETRWRRREKWKFITKLS